MNEQVQDRRTYKRIDMSCPVVVFDMAGKKIAKSQTVNLSDGGMLLSVPAESLPAVETDVNITLSVPRTTANTYMLEDFAGQARVTRHEPLADKAATGFALKFYKPMAMMLET